MDVTSTPDRGGGGEDLVTIGGEDAGRLPSAALALSLLAAELGREARATLETELDVLLRS